MYTSIFSVGYRLLWMFAKNNEMQKQML